MALHAADVTPAQAAYPWLATLKTFLAVGVPAFTLALFVAPQLIQVILAGYGPLLPAGVQAWLLGAASVVTATAVVETRIMAIMAVAVPRVAAPVDVPAAPAAVDVPAAPVVVVSPVAPAVDPAPFVVPAPATPPALVLAPADAAQPLG